MKRKELKNLATKIAKLEMIIQRDEDPKQIQQAKDEIMKLSGHVDSLEDIVLMDELIQEILKNS